MEEKGRFLKGPLFMNDIKFFSILIPQMGYLLWEKSVPFSVLWSGTQCLKIALLRGYESSMQEAFCLTPSWKASHINFTMYISFFLSHSISVFGDRVSHYNTDWPGNYNEAKDDLTLIHGNPPASPLQMLKLQMQALCPAKIHISYCEYWECLHLVVCHPSLWYSGHFHTVFTPGQVFHQIDLWGRHILLFK